MIVPMYKYTFLVFHKEYKSFLKKLHKIGVLHVIEKDAEITEDLKQKYAEVNQLEKVIEFLKKRKPEGKSKKVDLSAHEIRDDIIQKQEELEAIKLKLEEASKELNKVKPWGEFSPESIKKLNSENIQLRFYFTTKKDYLEYENSGLPVEIISETGNQLLFVLIQREGDEFEINAEEAEIPKEPYTAVEKRITELKKNIENINALFDNYAAGSVDLLEQIKIELADTLKFTNVILNTSKEAEEKLMVLEGWVPKSKKQHIDSFLEKNETLYISNRGKPGDKIPVLLRNNRFNRLFEPIGSMFSLPDYSELDLTVFFAPFFMLFFGFCLGDAGYGLLFIIGAGIYKFKAKKEIRPYLSLIQLLGLATVIFGAVSGTFFGINLIETKISLTDNFRELFLDPNKMFNLSLILGGIQIIFGLFIRAANQARQFGFIYSLATYGWLVILLGSIGYYILTARNVIPPNKTLLISILSTGSFLVLFFSDPGVNVFTRIGKGIWDVYSTVTGIFGDLLSYIRLFALGLSSAILGFVINDIGLQILGSSKITGPIFFVIFLILGHTLNILISSLGSFVHPMRLTFVEFYKNAGFKGGGEEYKPFSKE
jgi:V/A-type H+-transporting ATPase subunit I